MQRSGRASTPRPICWCGSPPPPPRAPPPAPPLPPPPRGLTPRGGGAEAGLTMEKAQAVLVAIAPVVGSARVTAAAGAIIRGVLGAAALTEPGIPAPRTPRPT